MNYNTDAVYPDMVYKPNLVATIKQKQKLNFHSFGISTKYL